MFPVLVAIPLLVILLAAVLFGEMSLLPLEPYHAVIAAMLWIAMTYIITTFLIEDSRELD
jgi:hypothetical protein